MRPYHFLSVLSGYLLASSALTSGVAETSLEEKKKSNISAMSASVDLTPTQKAQHFPIHWNPEHAKGDES